MNVGYIYRRVPSMPLPFEMSLWLSPRGVTSIPGALSAYYKSWSAENGVCQKHWCTSWGCADALSKGLDRATMSTLMSAICMGWTQKNLYGSMGNLCQWYMELNRRVNVHRYKSLSAPRDALHRWLFTNSWGNCLKSSTRPTVNCTKKALVYQAVYALYQRILQKGRSCTSLWTCVTSIKKIYYGLVLICTCSSEHLHNIYVSNHWWSRCAVW